MEATTFKKGEMMSDDQDRWEKAIAHARGRLIIYQELPGGSGAFASIFIQERIELYEKGDRSDALLEAMEGIK